MRRFLDEILLSKKVCSFSCSSKCLTWVLFKIIDLNQRKRKEEIKKKVQIKFFY